MAGMVEYLFEKSRLDKVDVKILNVLRSDARISLKDIAVKCNVSKQTALYRLNRLVKENVIKGFHAKIDYTKLGYSVYYVFIQTRYIENEKEFIEELSRINGCIVIMKSVTQYSFNIKIITKDIYATTKELEDFFNRKRTITSHFILQRLEKSEKVMTIDAKDKLILQELSINCRQNSLELSKKINLTYDVVHNRIKNLIKNKIIRNFTTILNFSSEGFMYYNILLKFADDQLDKLAVFDSMLQLDSLVVERFKCVGEFGYIFEIVDRDYISINDKFNKIRSQFHNMIRNSQLVPIQDHYFYATKIE